MDIGTDIGAIMVKEELPFFVKKEHQVDSEGFMCSRQTIKKNKQVTCTECSSNLNEIGNLNESRKKIISELTTAKQSCHLYFSRLQTCERALEKSKKECDELIATNARNENHVKVLLKQQQEQADKIQQITVEINRLNKEKQCDQECDVYNVEEIVGHKKENRKQMFLVRWEGFSPSQDSWVQEKDLFCAQILKNYQK